MLKHTDKAKIFSRRIFILLTVKSIAIFVLLSRLFQLQILGFRKYQTRADSNRIKSFVVLPLRGLIRDRNGEILATNKSYFRVLYNPSHNHNINELLDRLAQILDMKKENFYYVSRSYKRRSNDGYFLIHDNLTWDQVAKIEVNAPNLPGVIVDTAQRRYYPYTHYVAPTLGFVGNIDNKDINPNNKLLSHPDFKVGKTGIEKDFENYLRGKAGLKHVEVDAYGYTVRTLDLDSSKGTIRGSNLDSSIDIELQKKSYDFFAGKTGSAILMDITSGEVLVMCSTPSFDPNPLVIGIENQSWLELINNPYKPLINKPVSSTYPPGSTFKTLVALAALEKNIDPNFEVNCRGKTKLGRRIYHCWKEEGHGKVDMLQAIKKSCNIYFYEISKEVGIENIAAIAKEFGIGEAPILPIPNVKAGLLPNKEWKKEFMKESWVVGDTFNSAIGQGFLQTSNLQLAIMTARIASDGKKVVPTLLKTPEPANFPDLNIKKENIKIVKSGMYKVVNEKNGTAYWHRIRNRNQIMAGKTGTSQVVAIDRSKDLEQSEIEYRKRNHALFVGFAPYKNPRFAVSVIVEHGESGSKTAAPIAREILRAAQKKYL